MRRGNVLPGIGKKSLSERDICTKYITPALERAGWDVLSQVREEVNELMYRCDELETQLTTTATTRRQLLESTLHEALGRAAH